MTSLFVALIGLVGAPLLAATHGPWPRRAQAEAEQLIREVLGRPGR